MTDAPTAADAAPDPVRPSGAGSARQTFAIASAAIFMFAGVAINILTTHPNASDRATILQAAIGMAQLAIGYYLGSSAAAHAKAVLGSGR